MGGGSLPYFARYCAANFSFRLGSQRKQCDLARSCSLHQSPFFCASAATLGLQRLHTSSGTPCSAHHHPLWSPAPTFLGGAASGWATLPPELQPPAKTPMAIISGMALKGKFLLIWVNSL